MVYCIICVYCNNWTHYIISQKTAVYSYIYFIFATFGNLNDCVFVITLY